MQKRLLENIPARFLQKWQEMADLIANIVGVSAALVMRAEDEVMEVVTSSETEGNPYKAGDKEDWHGLYCETVIKTRKKLRISNALKFEKWKENPDVKLGMIAYLGYPLCFPDQTPFGTFCILDNKEQHFSAQNEKLLLQFKRVIELDLSLIYNLGLKNSDGHADVFRRLSDENERYQKALAKQKKAEEALKTSYSLLKIAGETARFGGWSVNLEDNICIWSDVVADIHEMPRGYTPTVEETIQFYAPDSRERITRVFNACVTEGIPYDEELEILTQKGKRVWVRTIGEAVRDEEGSILKVHGSFQDISRHKCYEQELKESEERFRALHNASFGGIGIHDKGIILECNQGLSEITGYSHEELIGMDGLLLIAEGSRDMVRRNIRERYEKPYEAEGLRKNGELYPLRIEAREIKYKGRDIRVAEFRDITQRKKAEEERERLENELRQVQKIESVGRLAGGVAHDFNNMLTVIIGHTEMALMQTGPEDPSYEHWQAVRDAAERSANLTRQLLAFARKQTIEPRVIDLNESVEEMLKMLRRLIGENIELIWKPGSNLGEVNVDPSQIDQILANLCVNSRDAITGVGQIVIETSLASFDEAYCAAHPGFNFGEYVCLSVKDNGCGMDAGTLSHIFEPFFTTKERGKGTGLGLSSVYGAVQQNKGFIDVRSKLGEGTTVCVYFPRHETENRPKVVEDLTKPDSTESETILLVEDEPGILCVTRIALEKMGYAVIPALTPEEAIDSARKYNGGIDLLVTDVVMPGMNGRDLAEKLLTISPGLKCLFMSGYTADVIGHQGVLFDGVHFIQKPFTLYDMKLKLREVLDEKSGG